MTDLGPYESVRKAWKLDRRIRVRDIRRRFDTQGTPGWITERLWSDLGAAGFDITDEGFVGIDTCLYVLGIADQAPLTWAKAWDVMSIFLDPRADRVNPTKAGKPA